MFSLMKKQLFIMPLLFVFAFTSAVNGQQQLQEHGRQHRKKIGVVLSGGGAKGFAHVGALKVLEEVGIPIDYIAGTSMGAVVGGLYAAGYSASMIDSLIQIQDWNHLMGDNVYRENLPASQRDRQNRYIFSLPYKVRIKERSGKVTLPRGVYAGQNLYNLFLNMTIGYQHEMDFDDLPIPFGCVAADVRSGKEIAIREGVLPLAIRASMAIPGVFTPVDRDSMLLIDGGVINNFPVDLVRSMGADIVIGINFPLDEKTIEKSRGSITEVTDQIWNFIGQQKRLRNIEDTDLLIAPDLHPYGSMDFQRPAINSIISRGEEATREKWDDLISLKESLEAEGSLMGEKKKENPYIGIDTLLIDEIRVEGVSKWDEEWILRWISVKGNKVTRKQLDEMTSRIYGSGWFSSVYYRLDGDQPFDLVFSMEIKESNTVNLGIHFDSNDMAAIIANTTIRLNTSLNSIFDITTRLSRDPYLMVNYSINRGIFYKGGINYKLSRNDLSMYERGKLAYNLGVTRNSLNLDFSEFYFGNIKLHLGAGIEHFHFFKALRRVFDPDNTGVNDQLYINYLFSGVYDNLNSTYFPSSGQYFSFQYTLHTDNFVRLKNESPLSVLKMNSYKPFPLGDHIFVTPRVSARYLMNDSVPYIYRNLAGGRIDGHYMPQQISLQGATGMEFLKNMLLSADVGLHCNFRPNNHLYANINFTIHNNYLQNLLQGESYLGANVGYSYLTVAGPLRLELGYSGLSRRFHPYLGFGYYF